MARRTITQPYNPALDLPVSCRPARLGNGLQNRQAIVHSLAHTESWAIDLSWDIIARFGKQKAMPREFFMDFVKVAQDKGRHFTLLAAQLEELARGLNVLPTAISRFRNGGDNETAELLERVVYREEITHCAARVRWFRYLCLRSGYPTLLQDSLAPLESEAGENGCTTEENEEFIQNFRAMVRTHFRGH
ncbi:hypothetical protein CISIN_1g041347mg [Citrus sinensis]|uniref:DUF455 domain-containing protein n=1 Tax=Citrus sinensis TaxID=2711 RepID=A0A067EN70_CITSI|nr:hypothetical protein CISIN_1g041347mg [Citrus sinensis]